MALNSMTFSAMTRDTVGKWLDGKTGAAKVPLYWFGTAAEALGLTGKVNSDMARQVLCDGIAPNGERLGLVVNFTYQNHQAVNYFPQPTVAYRVYFRPHYSVRMLVVDQDKRKAVMEAHRQVMAEELAMLERETQLGLVGVEARFYDVPESEIVFLATGRLFGGWRPLGTARDAIDVVIPAVQLLHRRYDYRIGQELRSRVGVKVKYKTRKDTKEWVAVVK